MTEHNTVVEENSGIFDLEEFFRQTEEEKNSIVEAEEVVETETVQDDSAINLVQNTPKKEKKDKVVKPKKESGPLNSWATPLEENKVYKFEEFDCQVYEFHPVMYPDGNFSGRYLPFCLDKNTVLNPDKKWVAEYYSLSNRFVVAGLNKFVSEMEKEVQFEKSKIYHTPFSMSYFAQAKGKSLKTFDKESTAFIFSIMTGIDSATISGVNTNISLMISNKYNGTGALNIDYVLNISGIINGNDYQYNDYFTLLDSNRKVNHVGKIKEFNFSIEELEKKAEETRTKLKTKTENLEDIIKSISSKMKKELAQKFNSHWEQLPPSMKNAFSILILASYVIDSNFDYRTYMAVRTELNKLVHISN